MFDSRYEVFLADTPESRALHHQIRYQVFCIEEGFEDPERFSAGQESDRWDNNAQHFVVRDKESGAGVAAGRIVLPALGQLPVDDLGCISEKPVIPTGRRQVAEVSRICMVRGDVEKSQRLPVQAVSRAGESEVMLGLIRAVIRYSWDHEIPQIYMLVTRPLARLLKRLGVDCRQVGDDIEYRGRRAPYLIDIDASWRGLVERSGEVADMFSRHHLAYFSHAAVLSARVSAKNATVTGVHRIAAA
jgi:N-acyl amino acid synthase of PEP-CTERM/exosortase system